MLLYSLQPLDSDALVRQPGDSSQVVLTAEVEKKERWNFVPLTKKDGRLLTHVEPNESGTTTSETRMALSVSTTKSFTTGLGVPACTRRKDTSDDTDYSANPFITTVKTQH